LFPDTSIDLQLTKDGKVQLQRGTSRSSSRQDSEEGENYSIEQIKQPANKQWLTKKQRKENRKKKSKHEDDSTRQEREEEDGIEEEENEQGIKKSSNNCDQPPQQQQQQLHQPQQPTPTPQQQQQQPPPKRGKKAKLKKIKEKYGEQDEEERQMKMEILASAGPAKESKAEKRKKEKKGAKGWGGRGANRPVSGKPGKKDDQTNKDQDEMSKQINLSAEQGRTLLNQENNVQVTEDVDKSESNEANFADQNSSTCRETGVVENNKENLVIDNDGTTNREKANLFNKSTEEASISNQVNIEENSVGAVYNEGQKSTTDEKDKEKDIVASDDEAEDLPSKEGVSLLDSLTGSPLSEDLLLFAIPVCAPYTAVQNYKYKVKLTPGTARRGKAAKTALNAFLFSKEASQREKDLIKSLKDNDLSRYIPGKVKVSAPNLQKKKRK